MFKMEILLQGQNYKAQYVKLMKEAYLLSRKDNNIEPEIEEIINTLFNACKDNRRKNGIKWTYNSKLLSKKLNKENLSFEVDQIKNAVDKFTYLLDQNKRVEIIKQVFKRNKFEVGQIIHNKGDMANNSGWFRIIEIIDYPNQAIWYNIKEIGGTGRVNRIHQAVINTYDQGNGLTKIVTKEAYIQRFVDLYGENYIKDIERELKDLEAEEKERNDFLNNCGSYEVTEYRKMYLHEIRADLKEKENRELEQICINCKNGGCHSKTCPVFKEMEERQDLIEAQLKNNADKIKERNCRELRRSAKEELIKYLLEEFDNKPDFNEIFNELDSQIDMMKENINNKINKK